MWTEPKNGNLYGGTFCCPHKIKYKESVSITFWGRAISLHMVLGSVISQESLAVILESFVFIFLYKMFSILYDLRIYY